MVGALDPDARRGEVPVKRGDQPGPVADGDDSADRNLAEIIDSQAIQSMMEDFSRLTGMASAILDTRGKIIEATGWQEICTRFHRVNSRTAAACTESDTFLADHLKPGEYVAYRCRNGLWDVVTPLYVGDRHVGNIYTGQFFYDDEAVDEAFFARQAEIHGFDRDAYLAALQKVPRVSREKVSSLMNYLVKFAGLISRLSYGNRELAQALAATRLAEAAVRESGERYHTLFENSGNPLMILNENTTIAQVNREFEQMSGYSRSEITGGMDLAAFLTGPDREKVLEYHRLRRIRPGAVPKQYETRITGRSGAIDVIMSVVVIPATSQSLVTFLDITARKKAEIELWALYHGLEERVQERTRELSQAQEAYRVANAKLNLLSGITRHDINNQLTLLQGYLGILKTKQGDPAFDDYFRKASDAARRISAMIRFTKEYESIGITAPVWQDLRALADSAAASLDTGSVRVVNDIPAGSEVFADPLIARVFFNLIDNAVRYGEKITAIRFTAEEREGGGLITCADDGVGIPAADKERIFDRGFGKNTGLGLFLSREILDITGIRITETGVPGEGARFGLFVPAGKFRSGQQ